MTGDALVRELETRFVTATVDVPLADETLSILKPRNSDDLISEADYVRDERLPYWADVWPSSVILAKRLAAEAGNGRSFLELGCGLGIVSITAMRAGYEVVASDYYDDALAFTRANAWRNLRREPAVRMIDWRALPTDVGSYDMIVAADVLYEMTYADLIADVLAAALAPRGTAIIADPGRIAVDQFVSACETRRLTRIERDTYPFVEGAIRQKITLFSIQRSR
ncbi:MAG TPA: methyltransferase domain-containing protein [Gemmatimonadaceae bacterium]|nr:methyltransferase domain-containing protein [Gemmatimonadaceae bacterium]